MADSFSYDGFISYSHAADGLLAPRLQAGLQRFAKPWWKRRALRLFRDESSLSANPHLWSSITEALDRSGWFVLLLSPAAAGSEWVSQEIEYWITNRDAGRILPVVTDGEFGWSDGDVVGDAVPAALKGVFSEEPRWVDLRWANDEDQLDLQDPRFADAVADIGSALRGVPKDELASEEVRQHRRTVRTAWTGGVALAALAVLAGALAIQSSNNAAEADENAATARANEASATENAQLALARELAASAVNVLEEDPELSILLTLEAIDATPAGVNQPAEVIDALWKAVQEDRLVRVIDTGYGGRTHAGLSGDGTKLAVSSEEGASVALYAVPSGEMLWEYNEETTDSFYGAFTSPDGSLVAVSVLDSTAIDVGRRLDPDDQPNRIVFLDAKSGSVVETMSFPDCANVAAFGWSPQGSYFAVSSGLEGCPRPDAADGTWVELLDGATLEPVALLAAVDTLGPVPRFDSSENLYVFKADFTPVEIYDAPDFEVRRTVDGIVSLGDVSADGTFAVTFNPGSSDFLAAYRTDDGDRIDYLRPLSSFVTFPFSPNFFPSTSRVAVATEGEHTVIWDIGTGEEVFKLPSGTTRTVEASPDERWLYTAHADGTVKVWDLGPASGLQSVGDLGTHEYVNGNPFFLGEALGSAVVIDLAEFDFRVVFFDRFTGELVGEPIGSGEYAPALPGDRFLVNVSGEWLSYDPLTGDREYISGCLHDDEADMFVCRDTGDPAPDFPVVGVGGTEIALPQDDETVTIIDAVTTEPVEQLAWPVDVEAFSSDWIFGWSDDAGSYVALDRATGEELARVGVAVPRVEVSEDGALIMLWEQDTLRLTTIDTSTWATRSVVTELGRVRGMSVDPALGTIALGDESGLYLFDIAQERVTSSIPLPSVSDIHWFDDRTVLIGTTNGVWARVPLRTAELVDAARNGVTRTFTAGECLTYRIDPCPSLGELRGG